MLVNVTLLLFALSVIFHLQYGDLQELHDMNSSLFASVTEYGTFDLILANPPYIPSPPPSAHLPGYGDGVPSGEDVTAAIVRNLE